MKRILLFTLALCISAPALGANINDAVTKTASSSRFVVHTKASGVSAGGPITGPLGESVMADSVAVVIASDQSPVTVNIGDAGALALEATQLTIDTDTGNIATSTASIDTDTGNIATSVASIDTDATTIAADTTSLDAKIPAQGQAAMAASVPVAIASDQSAVPVSGTVTANLGTIADVATQTTLATIDTDTGNIATSVASIDTDTTTIAGDTTSLDAKVPAQGQAVMASSLPIVIASDQSAVPVSGTVTANLGTIADVATQTTLATIDTDTGNIATSTASIDTDTTTIASDTTSIDADTTAIELNTDTGTGLGEPFTVSCTGTVGVIDGVDADRRSLIMQNAANDKIYVGGPAVTTSIGMILLGGQVAADGKGGILIMDSTGAMSCITDGGTELLRVWELKD